MVNKTSLYFLSLLTTIFVLIPQLDGKTQNSEIGIQCGKPQNFSSLQIIAPCPVDQDRDDAPDEPFTLVKFTNQSDSDTYLTYEYKTSYGTRSGIFLTSLIKARSSISLPKSNDQFDYRRQAYQYYSFKIGKPNIVASESYSDQLSCQDVQGITKRQFGVEYKLECVPKGVAISFVMLPTTQARAFVIKYRTREGINQVISMPESKYNASIRLPEADNYQVQILIPKSNSQLTFVQPAQSSIPQSRTNLNSQSAVAIVFDPPSNIRVSPTSKSEIICSIDSVKKINVYESENGWYKTDACDRRGYIHRSQIRFP